MTSADCRSRWAAVGLLFVGWVLRLVGIGDLRVFGDSASSIAFASRSWTEIAAATAIDSHPPLYYYLLRASLDLLGWTEFGARFPSLAAGLLLVAVVLRAAGAGRWPMLLAGALAAASPVLVYYSRLPRMYALLALLAFLVVLLAVRRANPILVAVTAFAALMTHYLAVVPVGIAVLLAVWPQRRSAREAYRTLLPFAVAGLAWLPWLAYALPASFAHTERTISGVPPPPTIAHFLGSLAVFVPVGTFVPLWPSIGLAVLGWVAAVLAFRRGWPLAALLIGVVFAAAIYLAFPAFGRPRFFIVLVPVLLVAVATGRRWIGFGLVAVSIVSLVPTYAIERDEYELDAVRLAEALDGIASRNDLVILQPWWQGGYLDLHLATAPQSVDLRDVTIDRAPAITGSANQIWLAMVNGTGRRDPAYPIEAWLDDRFSRIDEQVIGATRLVRYAPLGTQTASASAAFGMAFDVGRRNVAAGEAIPITASWNRASWDDRLVLTIQLLDERGQGWAGRDAEPLDGLVATTDLRGETIDRRGLAVPLHVPPGRYQLRASLYRRGDGARIGEMADLGTIQITAPTLASPPITSLNGINLRAVDLLRPTPARSRQTAIPTVDGVQTLTEAIDALPGEVIGVRLGWSATRALPPLTGFVHILDAGNRIVAQSDSPPAGGAYPTDRWPVGMLVYDKRDLLLPADLAPGTYRLLAGWYDTSGRLGQVEIGPLRVG